MLEPLPPPRCRALPALGLKSSVMAPQSAQKAGRDFLPPQRSEHGTTCEATPPGGVAAAQSPRLVSPSSRSLSLAVTISGVQSRGRPVRFPAARARAFPHIVRPMRYARSWATAHARIASIRSRVGQSAPPDYRTARRCRTLHFGIDLAVLYTQAHPSNVRPTLHQAGRSP